jgi:hypothetical protein
MTKVAILGCGPAGIFAAHAAWLYGADVRIFSKNRKSHMRGAQYLHRHIPDLSGDPFQIDYRLDGTTEGYRNKVYGDMSDVQVSPETLTGVADAWDIREAYDAGWDRYRDRIVDMDLSRRPLHNLIDAHDIVISTIPAPLLCRARTPHEFISQKVWSTDFVKPLGWFEPRPLSGVRDNLVVCSGHEDDWWYRAARIQGWETTEFPHDRKPNAKRVWEVEKPISTDCACNPTVHRLGRYGQWKKGVLSDAAFYDAEDIMIEAEAA